MAYAASQASILTLLPHLRASHYLGLRADGRFCDCCVTRNIRCSPCDWEHDVPRRHPPVRALYKCQRYREPVTTVSVFSWAEWLESEADKLEAKRRENHIGRRKQNAAATDRDISAAGLGAELAACVIVAPWKLTAWLARAERGGANRGEDFPAAWFRDGRSIEVKYTPRPGHLLIRPPANTPGPMRTRYIDDSVYVLVTGSPYT